MSSQHLKIAFIGTGVMGKSMAGHLLRAGHPMVVHNRTRSRAEDLIKQGAHWADTPAEAARHADMVISIVGHPTDVRSIYLDQNGILDAAQKNSLVIDMTTSSPSLAVEIYKLAAHKKISSLDAPVSGGDIGAREAELSIMVGGDEPAFERAKPIFELMGTTVQYQGKAGSGQHTKLSNQIVVAGNMIGMVEGLFYARKAGLDMEKTLKILQNGAAASWSLQKLAPRILQNDYQPGFMIEHFVKDMGLILAECHFMGIQLKGLEWVRKLYQHLLKQDKGLLGTQALIQSLDELYPLSSNSKLSNPLPL